MMQCSKCGHWTSVGKSLRPHFFVPWWEVMYCLCYISGNDADRKNACRVSTACLSCIV